jgi:hypothetical protein
MTRDHSPDAALAAQSKHAEEPTEEIDDVIAERDRLRAEVTTLRDSESGARLAMDDAHRQRARAAHERDDARDQLAAVTADVVRAESECERLRAIVGGRTTPPRRTP